MEFTLRTEMKYKFNDDLEVNNVWDFQRAVASGNVEIEVYNITMLDEDGDEIVNSDDNPDIIEVFMGAMTETGEA